MQILTQKPIIKAKIIEEQEYITLLSKQYTYFKTKAMEKYFEIVLKYAL